MTPDAMELIEKHRSTGVLVDANLLVLYLVGTVNRRRIQDFKRTQAYTVEDFDLLERLLACFGRLVSTPHVLAQVSDLTDLRGKELLTVRALFKEVVEVVEERYEESRVLVRDTCYERLGLTDAAIATLCRRDMLVLTDDLTLWDTLARRAVDALNFNHIRPISWM